MSTTGYVTLRDHENEPGHTLIHLRNLDATNYNTITTNLDNYKNAIAPITLGTIEKAYFTKEFPEASGYPSSDGEAQRQKKWTLSYLDNCQFMDVGNTIPNGGYLKTFTLQIPTPDLSLLPDGESNLDLSAGVGLAFKTAFDANVRSPYNWSSSSANSGNPFVLLTAVTYVGKR